MDSLDIIKIAAPKMFLPILALLAAAVALLLIKRYLYHKRLAKLADAGIGDIDNMDGRSFEQYVEAMYRRKGYKTERTPYRGDFGGDLIIAKDGVKAVVQAKRWNRKVGVKAVQEAVAAKGYYSCEAAIVISNSNFTAQAVELARRNGVALVGRNELLGEFDALAESAKAGVDSVTVDDSRCSRCGKRMTPKEVDYCLRFKDRFQDAMLCYVCQRSKPSRSPI